MSDVPSETPHTIEAVGRCVIQALENQTKAMDQNSKSLSRATYALFFATFIIAIGTVVGTVVVLFYP